METEEGVKAPDKLAAFVKEALPFVEQIARFATGNCEGLALGHDPSLALSLLYSDLAERTASAIEAIEALGDQTQILQALEIVYQEVFQNRRIADAAFSVLRDNVQRIRAERIKNPPYLREAFEVSLRDKFIQYSVALDYPEKRRRLSDDELKQYHEYTNDDKKRIFQEIVQLVAKAVSSEGFDVIMPLVIATLNDLAKKTDVIKPVQAENPNLEVFAMGICHAAALFNESQ